jgi:hypothetical protein
VIRGWPVATLRCFGVECFKLRRTLAPVIAVLFPLVAAAIETISVVNQGFASPDPHIPRAGWFLYGVLGIWCFALLPLSIALESSLTAGIEHQNHGFRKLLCLPVPRASVYAAKLAINLVLLFVSFVMLLACTRGFMVVATWMRPDVGLDAGFPWSVALRIAASTFLASLFLLAIHSYVALRWASFSLNVSLCVVGMVGTVTFTSAPLARVYPWGVPAWVEGALCGGAFGWDSSGSSAAVPAVVLCAVVAFGLIALVGGRSLVRRDVA